jgi:hypothetical protein
MAVRPPSVSRPGGIRGVTCVLASFPSAPGSTFLLFVIHFNKHLLRVIMGQHCPGQWDTDLVSALVGFTTPCSSFLPTFFFFLTVHSFLFFLYGSIFCVKEAQVFVLKRYFHVSVSFSGLPQREFTVGRLWHSQRANPVSPVPSFLEEDKAEPKVNIKKHGSHISSTSILLLLTAREGDAAQRS